MGRARGRQMYAQLMGAAGQGPAFQKGEAAEIPEHAKLRAPQVCRPGP